MNKNSMATTAGITLLTSFLFSFHHSPGDSWQSKWVKVNKDNSITYTPDDKGNTIPDFSYVGYYNGDSEIPTVPVVKIISAAAGSSEAIIQAAINEVSKRTPDANGFRGAILLKKGVYSIPGVLKIQTSGVILRGEGNEKNGTLVIAAGEGKRTLLDISGSGAVREQKGSRMSITDAYVPVGTMSFSVASAKGLKAGDSIIIYRPGTEAWIRDLKMNQIVERPGTQQWKASGYNLTFERIIRKIEGNRIFIDNPIVMAMETKYGGGEIYKYSFNGRIEKVGVENIYFQSEFANDTAENHGWDALAFDKVQNGWVRNISAQYFGHSGVNLENNSRNITVMDSYCFDPKSIISGGRRYSFNNNGQMNLFISCHAIGGRHDFVTGARVGGPNAYVNCTAKNTHADIGPHHRWGMGMLYDNITTDGEINVRDRGNYGTGHGWAGVNQVIWNCKAKTAIIENPWVTGNNWVIGLKAEKKTNKLGERPEAVWEGHNKEGLQPETLYYAQLKARQNKKSK